MEMRHGACCLHHYAFKLFSGNSIGGNKFKLENTKRTGEIQSFVSNKVAWNSQGIYLQAYLNEIAVFLVCYPEGPPWNKLIFFQPALYQRSAKSQLLSGRFYGPNNNQPFNKTMKTMPLDKEAAKHALIMESSQAG